MPPSLQYLWGWNSIVAEWRAVGYGTVAAVIGLLVSTYFVRAWRLYDYFPRETSGRFIELFHLAQVHNLLNIMLPFRSGGIAAAHALGFRAAATWRPPRCSSCGSSTSMRCWPPAISAWFCLPIRNSCRD